MYIGYDGIRCYVWNNASRYESQNHRKVSSTLYGQSSKSRTNNITVGITQYLEGDMPPRPQCLLHCSYYEGLRGIEAMMSSNVMLCRIEASLQAS